MKYVFIILFFGTQANAQEATVQSPNGKVRLKWTFEHGALRYVLSVDGKGLMCGTTVLQIDCATFPSAKNRIAKQKKTAIKETFSMKVGKASSHTFSGNELRFYFENTAFDTAFLVCRAYNDGAAFRWQFYKKGRMTVSEEKTVFAPTAAEAYIQKWDKAYEGFYDLRRLDTISAQQKLLFPFLFSSNQIWCLVSEAGAFSLYPGVQLKRTNDGLQTLLPQASFSQIDSVTTPWRLFVSGSLNDVVQTTLPFHLNPPPESGDWEWVTPGVATFPWWGDHFASSDINVLKRYVDLADKFGWEWIEFDVALVGTDYHTSKLWESTDWLREFTAYAHSKGIKVYGWDELKVLDTKEGRARVYGRYKALGIDGIKIDFLDSDELAVMQFRKAALEDAATYKLMVSFHGETIPRGQQRTFPNLMTHEGVRGAEYYTFPGFPMPTPEHNCTLPFTRNVIGSMDYTPAAFTAKNRITTTAHELALPFVFESGWNVMADVPEAYLNSPAREALKNVEAAWDKTQFLDGYPGRFVVMARQKGKRWAVAGINAGEARTVEIDLRSMISNEATVSVYTDDVEGKTIVPQTFNTLKKKLSLPMRPNGGFVFFIEAP